MTTVSREASQVGNEGPSRANVAIRKPTETLSLQAGRNVKVQGCPSPAVSTYATLRPPEWVVYFLV